MQHSRGHIATVLMICFLIRSPDKAGTSLRQSEYMVRTSLPSLYDCSGERISLRRLSIFAGQLLKLARMQGSGNHAALLIRGRERLNLHACTSLAFTTTTAPNPEYGDGETSEISAISLQ